MNKLFYICIASALLLTGCANNSGNEIENDSDVVVTTVASEKSLEATENTTKVEVTSENITKTADIDNETKIIVTSSEKIENTTEIEAASENSAITVDIDEGTEINIETVEKNDHSYNSIQKELPIISEENQKSEVEVTEPIRENQKETVTATSVQDDVIELPFVPVR